MIDNSEESRTAWATRAPWGVREIVQAAGVFGAGLLFFGATIALIGVAADVDLSDAQITGIGLVATVFMEIGLFGLAAVFSVAKLRLPWRALGFRLPDKDHLWVPIGVTVACFLSIGIYGIVIQLLGLDDELLPEDTLGEDIFDNRALTALAGVVAVIAAPLAEETFFRGFMFGGLVRRMGFVWAALASGFLFSLLHGQPGALIPFTFVGVAFAWAYAYTGSIWSNIAAHLLYNGVIFTVAVGGWGG